MTRKLEELFNLPSNNIENPTPEESKEFIEQNRDVIVDINNAIDKIDAALPTVHDLDTGDEELDELAKLATEKFEDMCDLGMNVEPRFSGVILQTAGVMLGHAITAKTAKLDKKLRMVSLQLQKARLDHQVSKDNKKDPIEEAIDGQGLVLDRNDLLKQILNKSFKPD
jgi:hypothetical protein